MKRRAWDLEDKSDWAPGPWRNEPDKVQWRDKKTAFACLAVRNTVSGAWCGYVGVEPAHPLYGKFYSKIDVDVHGGLTFAGKCMAHGRICHVVEPGEPDDVWWLGFDCGHCLDVMPGINATLLKLGGHPLDFPGSSYKTLKYVKSEVRRLAAQLRRCAA